MNKATAVLATLMLALAACGGGDSDDAADTTASSGATDTTAPDSTGGEATVTIADFAFEVPESVPVGSSAVVTNTDGATHTFTAEDGSFDTGSLAAEATATVTFAAAGTIEFFCEIHPSMTGSIVVEG